VEQQRDAGVDLRAGAGGAGELAGAVVALGERAAARAGRGRPAVRGCGDPVGVRSAQVVEDGVRAVEAVAGEALLVAELTLGAAQLGVVLARDAAELHAVEHQASSSAPAAAEVLVTFCCSRSTLSNSARKLP